MMIRIDNKVPRPTTVLSASLPDLVSLKKLKDEGAKGSEDDEGSGSYQNHRYTDDTSSSALEAPLDKAQASKTIKAITKQLTKPSPLAVRSK